MSSAQQPHSSSGNPQPDVKFEQQWRSVNHPVAGAPGASVVLKFYSSLAPLENIWRQLESSSNNYAFQTYDWTSCWQQQVGVKQAVAPCPVLVESTGGIPLMLLPLGICKSSLTSTLIWLGGKLADYHSALFTDAALDLFDSPSFLTLWHSICLELPSFDVILLEKQPARIGRFDNPFILPGCTAHSCNAHSANLDGSLESFIARTQSVKWQKKERRSERRLEEAGKFRFVTATTAAELHELLPTMMRQKSRSYMDMGVPDIFEDESYRNFVAALTNKSAGTGFVCFFGFYIGERLAATAWGLAYKSRFYYLLPTYEKDELSRYSPGNVMLRYIFDWCFINNINVFDFTAGDEDYKTSWCDETLQLYDYISGTTLLGRIVVVKEKLLRAAKRYIKNSPTLFQIVKRLRTIR